MALVRRSGVDKGVTAAVTPPQVASVLYGGRGMSLGLARIEK